MIGGIIRKSALASLILGATACELSEVTIPGSRDELVVEAVLRANDPLQRILLHRTLEGPTIRGEPGAQVRVIDEAGNVHGFEEGALEACVTEDTPTETEASCYVSSAGDTGWVRPGETYELDIVSAQDEQLRGRTTVPADFRLLVGAEEGPEDSRCTLAPEQEMRIEWTRSSTAAAYLSQILIHGLPEALEGRGIPDIPDPLKLTGVSVTAADTHTELPAAFGIFERFDENQDLMRAIRTGFPAGVRVDLFILATDVNVVNAYREDEGTGPIANERAAGIVGDGIGLFGSVVPQYLGIDVTEEDAGPRCVGQVEAP